MSTTTCPNCGKPLRPGARFCGNCGATLSATPTPRVDAIKPAPDEAFCPHCGKPIRPEARFCNSCGKPVTVVSAAVETATLETPVTKPDAVVIPTPSDTVHTENLTQPQPVLKATAAVPAPPAAKPEMKATEKPVRRSGIVWIVALVIIAGCGLAVVAGYFAARQFGWLGGGEPLAVLHSTPTSSPEGPAQTVTSPTTEIISPPATSTLPAPTNTATQPSAQPTNTPTPKPSATPPASSTETAPIPDTGHVLFEDLFDEGLREHWETWGEPRATIGTGFGDNWLSLKALEPGQAGVTSRPEFVIPNGPGVKIEFDGEMDEKYPQAVLVLDWDPAAFGRGPENQEVGIIRLEIRPKQIKLLGRAAREDCEQALTSTVGHTYLLRITENQGVALFLDSDEQPFCQISSMELSPQPGKLSFSGLGWVSRVKVTLP